MAQVAIVSKPEGVFREYAVESGDTVAVISFRFGQADWQSVYDDPVNAAFKNAFPDPWNLQGTPVNLFVPLPGKSATGVSVHGAPLTGFLAARLVDPSGAPLANVSVRLIEPDVLPQSARSVTTSAGGHLFIANPKSGQHSLATPDYELKAPADVATVPPIESAVGLYLQDSEPTARFPLTPDVVNEVVAVPVSYVICPMCAVPFRLKANPAGPKISCLNDGFDLTDIENAVRAAPNSFISPELTKWREGNEHLLVTAMDLKCRGQEICLSPFGPVSIFWDESRFAEPNGEDYQLWAIGADGIARQCDVEGRKTWNAVEPKLKTKRKTDDDFDPVYKDGTNYEFHRTPTRPDLSKAPKWPYLGLVIPNNQTNRLSSVLKWITVHHTAHSVLKSGRQTVKNVQKGHQVDDGIDGSLAADIGYHFFIDFDGKISEGRPLGIAGSHVGFFNAGNVGIVLEGDFDAKQNEPGDNPKVAAVNALKLLTEVLALRFGIRSAWVHGQRVEQINPNDGTACPGRRLLNDSYVRDLHTTYPGPPE